MNEKKMRPEPKTTRILKVNSGNDSQYRPIPVIRLQGKWLKEFGFDIGDKVLVECQQGKLVITKEEKPEQAPL